MLVDSCSGAGSWRWAGGVVWHGVRRRALLLRRPCGGPAGPTKPQRCSRSICSSAMMDYGAGDLASLQPSQTDWGAMNYFGEVAIWISQPSASQALTRAREMKTATTQKGKKNLIYRA